MQDLVRVVVDAMGGDNAPLETVKGAVEAVNESKRIKLLMQKFKKKFKSRQKKKRLNKIEVISNEPKIYETIKLINKS